MNYDGEVLLELGCIDLSGRYPFIVGFIGYKGAGGIFYIDMRTDSVETCTSYDEAAKKIGFRIDFKKFCTFVDLKGQYGDSDKLKELQDLFKKGK